MDINRLVDIKIARFPRISAFDAITIISQYPNPPAYIKNTNNLLHIWFDDPQVLSFLLTHYDFDINHGDGYERTPVYLATKIGFPQAFYYINMVLISMRNNIMV